MENTVSLMCNKQKKTRSFGFYSVDGEIIDIQETTKTSISSTKSYLSGGSGFTPVVSGISGSTTQIQTIFIKKTDGQETDIRLINQPIALRVGNKISIICFDENTPGESSSDEPVMVGIVNHDTGKSITFGHFKEGGKTPSIVLAEMKVKLNEEWPLILSGLVFIGAGIGLGIAMGSIGWVIGLGILGIFVGAGAGLGLDHLLGGARRKILNDFESLRDDFINKVVNRGFSSAQAS